MNGLRSVYWVEDGVNSFIKKGYINTYSSDEKSTVPVMKNNRYIKELSLSPGEGSFLH